MHIQAFALAICVMLTADLAPSRTKLLLFNSEACFAETMPAGQLWAIDGIKCVVGHGSQHYISQQVQQGWQHGCC